MMSDMPNHEEMSMDQDPLGTVQALPENVSEGFPLMEGDIDKRLGNISSEEPEDRLDKLFSRSPSPQQKNPQQTYRNEYSENSQSHVRGRSSAVDSEDSSDTCPPPAKKQTSMVKAFRLNLPKQSPKKYPPLIKVTATQPKKPALQAIINDLRKEIEKENDTSKIDLPSSSPSGRQSPMSSAVKRKFGESERIMTPTGTSYLSVKKPRGYSIERPLSSSSISQSKSGLKPELVQMKQHKQIVSDVVKEMSQSGLHTDTVMIAGGQKISVHRLVLAASSPYLKSMLVDQPGEVTIILPETPYEDLAILIDYVYCGESVVPENKLSLILSLMSTLGFSPPIYTVRRGKGPPKPLPRPVPRPVSAPSPDRNASAKPYTATATAVKGAPVARPIARRLGGKPEEDTLALAVRHIDDSFAFAPDRKVGSCWIRQIPRTEANVPRKKAVGRKIDAKPDKPSRTVIKLKEPFDRHKPRKVIIQRLEEEGQEQADDVNAALALTSLGGQQQQQQNSMTEDLDPYQEGSYPESMLNSLLNSDHPAEGMSMPSLDAEDQDPMSSTELHKNEDDPMQGQEGAYMLEDGTIIQGGGIEGLPMTTEGADGTTYILVMDEHQENLDLNQVIQGLSGGSEGNQAMLRIEEDGTVSYAATEDQADGGMYSAADDENGLSYTGMSEEGFDGQQFEGQEYQGEYDLEGEEGDPKELPSLPPDSTVTEEGSSPNSDEVMETEPIKSCGKGPKSKKSFQCSECIASFRGLDSLSMHVARVHTGIPAFQCGSCAERFHTRPRLNAHRIVAHNEGEALVCHCGARFYRTDNYKVHLLTHENARPYKCGTCSRAYANKVDLLAHERSHRGERPFACSQCPKTFNMARHLKLHVERMHVILDKCDSCGANISSLEMKVEHDFMHETGFVCIVCSEKCNDYVNWCTHVLVHQQFVCLKCGVVSESEEAHGEHSAGHEAVQLESTNEEVEGGILR